MLLNHLTICIKSKKQTQNQQLFTILFLHTMHIKIYGYINALLRYDMKQSVKTEWKEYPNLSDANGAAALASISRFTCCKASSSVTVTIKNQVCKFSCESNPWMSGWPQF